jgi:hypothetical protein
MYKRRCLDFFDDDGHHYTIMKLTDDIITAAIYSNESLTRAALANPELTAWDREMGLCYTLNHGHFQLARMYYEEYNMLATHNQLRCAIMSRNYDIAMYVISRGAPIIHHSLLWAALISRMYDLIDFLLPHVTTGIEDSGLMMYIFSSFHPSPIAWRYFVKIGGWMEDLDPRDYRAEISRRMHSHHPILASYLGRIESPRVYSNMLADIVVVSQTS